MLARLFAVIVLCLIGSGALAQPEQVFLDPDQAQAEDSPVRVELTVDRTGVRPGDQIAAAIVFHIIDGWHIYSDDPQVTGVLAIPTEIKAVDPVGVKVGGVQWPKAVQVKLRLGGTKPEPANVFEGRSVAYLPLTIAADAAGRAKTAIEVSFQACNDRTCLLAETVVLEFDEPVLAAGQAVVPTATPQLFEAFDRAGFGAGAPRKDSSLTFREFGLNFTIDTAGAGLMLLLLLALAGGFVLNLTPCVLPVIPLKMMGLSHQAGNRRRALLLGVVMSVGVVAFWLTIGGLMATLTNFKAINQLFQQPFFTIGVGLFILVMAVGMLGLFSVRLPQFVYLVDPRADTVSGSFVFGVMTAVLSTPCTAPFMGTAAGWATKQSTPVTMAVFAAIGLGMALPYLVLAAFPALLAKVPRSGPASDLVKQVIGLLMVAVAIFFLGTGLDPLLRLPVDPPIRWFWWIILALVVAAMGWMLVRTIRITPRAGPRSFAAVFALVFAGASAFAVIRITDRGPIQWIGYTPERFEEARRDGKVVVIDFTAEWCANCKLLEGTVLHTPEVAALLNSDRVAALKVDLTGRNAPGQAKLTELNWVGIPLLAIYTPGSDDPIKYDWYTTAMVIDAVKAGPPLASDVR